MRIAYITQSYPPMVSGAAIVTRNLAENMADRDHKVLVIAASDRGESYKSIKGNLTLLRLRSFDNPLRVGQRFMLIPKCIFLQSLRDFQPDLIHSHDPLQLGMLCLNYKREKKIPVLLTSHALPNFVVRYIPATFSKIKYGIETSLWMYAWWILRQYDAITTPTPTASGMIFATTKVQPISISNGVDLATFSPTSLTSGRENELRTRLGLPQNVPVILHVGRLDADKHGELVVKATALTMQQTQAHLLMVGDGRQKTALMQLCKSLGIEKRCHFTGFITVPEGLPEIYRLASLFITASEIETQGIVLLEAAASGLPIAAVRATCIPEIVHDGVNGYLVMPNDINSLSDAITDLLLDPANANEMGKAGRQIVKRHNVLDTLDSYENLYIDLVQQKAVQRATKKGTIPRWQERAKEWLNM